MVPHVVGPEHRALYGNGELLWGLQESGLGEPTGRLKGQDIVFVLRNSGKEESGGGYLVYGLAEQPDDAEHPWDLRIVHVQDLPRDVLDAHLFRQLPDHLDLDSGRRRQLHVVVSTRSGLCRAQVFYDDVLQPLLLAAGVPVADDGAPGYELTVTQSASSVRDIARRLWGEGSELDATGLPAQTVILLSGDGGVIDLLNGGGEASPTSSGPRPSICVLPLGTGNALFHSNHKPLYDRAGADASVLSAYVLGLRTLFGGVTAPLPAFEATFSPGSRLVPSGEPAGEPVERLVGAIVASYGFHASLVWESDTAENRKHGAKRFGMAAQALLETSHAYRADVEVVDVVEKQHQNQNQAAPAPPCRLERERFAYVLATAVSNLERTFCISPASRPLAGDLRLVHFGDVDGARTMEIMQAAYNGGRHVNMTWTTGAQGGTDGVGYDAVDSVTVTVREADARWRKVCIDGTIVELPEGGWMTVKNIPRSRLDVLVNPSAFSASTEPLAS